MTSKQKKRKKLSKSDKQFLFQYHASQFPNVVSFASTNATLFYSLLALLISVLLYVFTTLQSSVPLGRIQIVVILSGILLASVVFLALLQNVRASRKLNEALQEYHDELLKMKENLYPTDEYDRENLF